MSSAGAIAIPSDSSLRLVTRTRAPGRIRSTSASLGPANTWLWSLGPVANGNADPGGAAEDGAGPYEAR